VSNEVKTEAIVASAGVGKRLAQPTRARVGRIRKPYLKISGKPILIHTLKALNKSAAIHAIIIVVNRSDKKRCEALIKRYGVKRIKAVVVGGAKRSDSVYNGLRSLDKDTKIVLIHDGVRPFVDEGIVDKSIDCAKRFGACIVGVPVKATVKRVKGIGLRVKGQAMVERTIDRRNIWEIQTPQVFRRDLILEAYRKFRNCNVTDDAMLVEKLGAKVHVITGSYKNIKITTAEDLVLAEAIASNK
jgi:2-C-methyl-D-erythritol 4-phosphate cytidylyltransferase